MPHDVFVSYSSQDITLVRPLVDGLHARGVPLWWDTRQLECGEEISPRIRSAIRDTRYALCILSDRCRAGYVRAELDFIAERNRRYASPRLIVVECVHQSDLFWRSDWPIFKSFLAISCRWKYGDEAGAPDAAELVTRTVATILGRDLHPLPEAATETVIARRHSGYWRIALPAYPWVRLHFSVRRGGRTHRTAHAGHGDRIPGHANERLVLRDPREVLVIRGRRTRFQLSS